MTRAAVVRQVFLVALVATCFSLTSVPSAGAFGFLNGVNMNGEGIAGNEVQLYDPADVAEDSQGNFYVVDSSNHRIVKLSSSGALISRWGTQGNSPGQFSGPTAIAIDSSDVIYVSDTNNHRIQKFEADGDFLGTWGSSGTGDGQFAFPTGLAFGPDGNLYVVDCNNSRIEVFNTAGVLQFQFGAFGSDDGQMRFPIDIAVNSTGAIYVAEYQGRRVQQFSPGPTPAYVNKWGESSSSGDYGFGGLSGIALDSSSNVYVADGFYNRIKQFSSAGTFVRTWGTYGSDDGSFKTPKGVFIDDADKVYVSDAGNGRIQRFDGTGLFEASFGVGSLGDGHLLAPSAVAAAPDGGAYVADSSNDRVQRFDASGAFVSKWGSAGAGDGQFSDPSGIAVAPNGDVYVVDSLNSRVQRFSADGTFIGEFGSSGAGDGQLANPGGIAIDGAGNVYVANSDNQRIEKFSSTGTFLARFGQNGSGNTNNDFSYPLDVAVNAAGSAIYVIDSGSSRIKSLDSSGALIETSHLDNSGFGVGDGQFRGPQGIDLDASSGTLLVADSNNNRIQRFSTALGYLGQWGSLGGALAGDLQRPAGVASDSFGNVWVADTRNNRMQRFGEAPVVTFAPQPASTIATSTALDYEVTDPGADCSPATGTTVPLSLGANSFVVTCTNSQGSDVETLSITRTAPPAAVDPPVMAPSPAAVTLKLPKKLKLSNSRKLKFSVTCPDGCTVTPKLMFGKKSSKLKAVRKAAGASPQTVTITLSKKMGSKAKAWMVNNRSVYLNVTVQSYKATQGKTGKAKLAR